MAPRHFTLAISSSKRVSGTPSDYVVSLPNTTAESYLHYHTYRVQCTVMMRPPRESTSGYQDAFQLQLRCESWEWQQLDATDDGYVSVMAVVPMVQCVGIVFAMTTARPVTELSVRFMTVGQPVEREDTWASEHMLHMVFELV
jgi:hypothetical protein